MRNYLSVRGAAWGIDKVDMKKVIYFDMDGVLADFESGLAQVSEDIKKEYIGRYDEIPGLFSLMPPMPGAIDAVHRINSDDRFDCYILSTAPWNNPSAWSDKLLWVQKHLDDVFHKRIIITHCKNLLKGDYLMMTEARTAQANLKANGFSSDQTNFLVGIAC